MFLTSFYTILAAGVCLLAEKATSWALGGVVPPGAGFATAVVLFASCWLWLAYEAKASEAANLVQLVDLVPVDVLAGLSPIAGDDDKLQAVLMMFANDMAEREQNLKQSLANEQATIKQKQIGFDLLSAHHEQMASELKQAQSNLEQTQSELKQLKSEWGPLFGDDLAAKVEFLRPIYKTLVAKSNASGARASGIE